MHLLLLFQGRFDSTNDPDNQKKNSIDNGTKQIAPTATIETYSIFIILPFNFEWTFKTNEESRMRKEASGNDLGLESTIPYTLPALPAETGY